MILEWPAETTVITRPMAYHACMDRATAFIPLANAEERLRTFDGGDGVRDIRQWIITLEERKRIMQMGDGTILTDDHAPTDNLLAPMFESAAQ